MFRMEDGDAREAEKLLTNLFDYFAHSFCHLKTAKEYCISLTEELKELMPRELPVNRTKTLSLNLMNHLSVIFSFQELWGVFSDLLPQSCRDVPGGKGIRGEGCDGKYPPVY